MLGKYKYYFRKPKSEITKDVFTVLATGALICVAASSPYFATNIIKGFSRWKKYPHKRIYNTFYRLRKKGLIKTENKNGQIYISLTKEGKKRAGMLQVDSLEIKKPKKWDRKWRILIFDIAQLKKIYREAFRGKIKQLGFCQLQKSVWVHPFDCKAETDILKDFFGLSQEEIRLIVAEDIQDDAALKEVFKIK